MLGMYLIPAGAWAVWKYVTRDRIEPEPLSDWVVVEEGEFKTATGSTDPVAVKVPVFFR